MQCLFVSSHDLSNRFGTFAVVLRSCVQGITDCGLGCLVRVVLPRPKTLRILADWFLGHLGLLLNPRVKHDLLLLVSGAKHFGGGGVLAF